MKTLLIVDLQNDFLPDGALAVPNADAVIAPINRIIERFDLVVATQDWHPQDHGSFASNHSDCRPFDVGQLNGLEQTFWPDHCVQGSAGAEFPAAFNSRAVEVIFRKGTDAAIDSYSAFYDNARRKSTGLADYLRGKGVTELYLCGLAADICVYFTALDALADGFTVSFIKDAAMPLGSETYVSRLAFLQTRGARIVTAADC